MDIFKFLKLDGLFEHLKGYLEKRFELFKLEMKEKAANIMATMLMVMMLAFTFFLMLIFMSLALGNYLNSLFNSSYMGFLILGIFFLVAGIIFAMNIGKGFLHKKIHDIAIGIINNKKKDK
ncbi:MAG: phage holin family protein [Cytophagaceae bacterium]